MTRREFLKSLPYAAGALLLALVGWLMRGLRREE